MTLIQCSGVDSGGGRIPLNFSNTIGSGIRPSGGESSSWAARVGFLRPSTSTSPPRFREPWTKSRPGRRHRRLLCPEAGAHSAFRSFTPPSRPGRRTIACSLSSTGRPFSRRTERLRSRPQLRLRLSPKPNRRCCRRVADSSRTTALSEHGYAVSLMPGVGPARAPPATGISAAGDGLRLLRREKQDHGREIGRLHLGRRRTRRARAYRRGCLECRMISGNTALTVLTPLFFSSSAILSVSRCTAPLLAA